MNNTITRNFYQDPGHGWVKVLLTELKLLGVADKISGYSYQRNQFVYLEEDCDLGTYMRVLSEKGITLKFRETHTDNRSRIRNYNSYNGGTNFNMDKIFTEQV